MARVLLVDDEPNIRWTMAELLRRQGFEPITAPDYESAIRILRDEEVDVAVVDIILPGKSGIELLKEICGSQQYIPVLMITGEPDLERVPEILRAGACDYMSKPVLKDALLQAVARALDNKRLVEEKKRLEREIKTHASELELLVEERARELVAAHSFLNTVLDSSTEYAIVALDTFGRITLFNQGATKLAIKQSKVAIQA